MITLPEVIHIGTLTRPHGKLGEIQCRMLNDYWDEAQAEFLVIDLDHILVPFRAEDWRGKGADSLIFQLRGIDTEQKAARLCGNEAYMLRKDMVSSPGEEGIYWTDLVGWKVCNADRSLGTVVEVDESTANVLGVLDSGELVPLHEDLILAMDEDKKTLTINYQI